MVVASEILTLISVDDAPRMLWFFSKAATDLPAVGNVDEAVPDVPFFVEVGAEPRKAFLVNKCLESQNQQWDSSIRFLWR